MFPHPKKRLGQNFLINKDKLTIIAESLMHHENDAVIEIGPGRGELTREILILLSKYEKKKLIVIEKDPELIPILTQSFLPFIASHTLEIIEGDVREKLPLAVASLQGMPYKIAGNIPYYLTGFLFRMIGDLAQKPTLCVFTVQKEVALRICAKPPHVNLLAASIQYWADAEIIDVISRKDFSPSPRVDSAVIRLITHTNDKTQKNEEFYSVLKILFQQPRKTILNNLKKYTEMNIIPTEKIILFLKEEGIEEDARPQALSVATIKKLADFLYSLK